MGLATVALLAAMFESRWHGVWALKTFSTATDSSRKGEYPIAGQHAGGQHRAKQEAPQSSTEYGLVMPDFSPLLGVREGDPLITSILTVLYCSTLPVFIWLTATARTPLMKNWFSAFNLGFMTAAVALKISRFLGVFPLLAILISAAASAVGVVGFKYPDGSFIFCGPLWGSYLLCNLLHILLCTNAWNAYVGLGRWLWLLLPATLTVFCLYLFAETKSKTNAQNFITAFTSAFAATAAISFAFEYFVRHHRGAYEILSFMSYPTAFRWSDPVDVTLFLVLIALVIVGIAVARRRDQQQESPGFGAQDKTAGAIAVDLAAAGYARTTKSLSSLSTRSGRPYLYFAPSDNAVQHTKARVLSPEGDSVSLIGESVTFHGDKTSQVNAASEVEQLGYSSTEAESPSSAEQVPCEGHTLEIPEPRGTVKVFVEAAEEADDTIVECLSAVANAEHYFRSVSF